MSRIELPDCPTVENLVHTHVNQVREHHDLGTVSFDEDLRLIARNYSRRMAEEEFFSHVSPEGSSLSDRYEAAGYDCSLPIDGQTQIGGGENLYTVGFDARLGKGGISWEYTPPQISQEAISGWLDSPGHRRNLLRPAWRRQGIGVAAIRRGPRIHVYVTQNFC